MTPPRHVVLRQVVEIQVPSELDGHRVQAAVSRNWERTWLPILEQSLDALGPGDALLRIPRLEIHLGSLPSHDWEHTVATRLEQKLPGSLNQAISAALSAAGGRHATELNAHVELLDHFAQTGTLPWWAEASTSTRIRESLDHLARHAPQQLTDWARTVARHPHRLRRLLLACAHEDLACLLGVLSPHAAPLLGWLADAISQWSPADSTPAPTRIEIWHCVLTVVSTHAPLAEKSTLLDDILAQTSARLRTTGGALAAALAAQAGTDTSAPAREFQEHVAGLRGHDAPHACPSLPALRALIHRLSARIDPAVLALDSFLDRLSGLDPDQRARLHDFLLELERTPDPDLDSADRKPLLTSQLIAILGSSATPGRTPDPDAEAPSLSDFPRSATRPGPAGAPGRPTRPDAAGQLKKPDADFSQADALYVHNAGLVMLWPFLERFFTRLGLVEDRRFKTDAASHRAVGLLQHLATNEREPVEYHVPLNKLLCGLDPDQVFDFGPPVTDEEHAECDALLEGVIAQAGIGQISTGGFRAAFLERTGQISSRDGLWVLRVERATHDVLLDTLPWPLRWVRLPWMPDLLQVEW